jgi:acylphosphatase
MKVTKHLIIRGRVHGVGFREMFQSEADRNGVTGWVRNRKDGTVEAMLHGWPDPVAKVVSWARRGPPAAAVQSMEIDDAADRFDAFQQRPTE